MAPRIPSVLVLTADPPAVEIFKISEVIPPTATVEVGVRRTFKRFHETDSYVGTILAKDWQTKLKKVLVTPDGVINPEAISGRRYLGTTKQERARLKKNQATARERALLELDEHIHEHGPPAPPEPQVKVIRLPIKRPAEQLVQLKEKLKTLKCFSERDSEDGPVVRVNLFAPQEKMKPVYITALAKSMALMCHKNDSAGMFRYLLNCMVPDDILQDNALSWSGNAETVQLPFDIISAAAGFANANAIGPSFNLRSAVQNFLWSKSHVKRKKSKESAPAGAPAQAVVASLVGTANSSHATDASSEDNELFANTTVPTAVDSTEVGTPSFEDFNILAPLATYGMATLTVVPPGQY